jgi:hypothetical protein
MYITPIWMVADFVQMALTDFKDLGFKKQVAIVGIFLFVTIVGICSDRADIQDRTETHTQLSNLQAENSKLVDLVGNIATNQAMAAKPGLRKDALELARTLIARSTQTPVLTGHDAMGDPSGWPKQAQTSNAQLVSDYNNIYANQVQSLRQRFILQGQKNWQNDRYYENPTTARDIQHIGFELLTHANALN